MTTSRMQNCPYSTVRMFLKRTTLTILVSICGVEAVITRVRKGDDLLT